MAVFIQIVIISLSLAMDAFSVSIAGGMKSSHASMNKALKVGMFFGGFQAGMPVIGWAIGETLKGFILSVDNWIAFILLAIIGIKMIREALNDDDEVKKDMLQTKTLTLLAIATSIDALIVGITLGLLEIPFVVSIAAIGVVTFVLSVIGFLFGRQLGALFGKRVEVLGGVALLLIGLKILLKL